MDLKYCQQNICYFFLNVLKQREHNTMWNTQV